MRRSPIKRRVSLRDSFLKKLKEEGTRYIWKRGTLKRQKPLKKQSKSQRNKLAKYYVIRDEFLSREENKLCEICRRRRESGENIQQNGSTEVHHKYGRGKMLAEERGFIASCFPCRLWPHENPRVARSLGLLG